MKISKKITILLVLTMLFTTLVSCADNKETPESETTKTATATDAKKDESDSDATAAEGESGEAVEIDGPGSDPFELSVAWWGGELRHEKTLSMIDKYMEKYPQATVVSTYAPFDDYFTKLATQAAGGNLPDVYLVQLMYIGEYASKGLMHPLQDLVDGGKIDVSSYTQGALSSSSYNGDLVGITFGDTAVCLAYNKTLIESVGYALPTDQMSYTEYADYLKGLADVLPDGHYASMHDWRHEAILENYVRQNGGYGLTNEEGTEVGYSQEMLADIFTYYNDLFTAGAFGPLEVILEDTGKQFGDSLMGNGKVAVWVTNVNQGKIFQASVEDEIGMARAPVVDDATNRNVEAAVPSTWAISSKSKNIDQAAHFISTMVNDWELQKIYDMDIGVPGSTKIQDNLIAGLDESDLIDVAKKREIELMQDILNTIEPFNGRPSGYGAIVDDLRNKFNEVFAGNMTPEQAAASHMGAAPQILA